MTLDRASKSIKDLLFKNLDLGLFISPNSTQVKAPLKSSSTLNQISKASPLLELECFVRQNATNQKIIVNELSSKVSAVSIPYHVVVWMEKISQIRGDSSSKNQCTPIKNKNWKRKFTRNTSTTPTQIDKIYGELRKAVVRQIEFVASCLKKAELKHGDEIEIQNYFHPFSILPITVPVLKNRECSQAWFTLLSPFHIFWFITSAPTSCFHLEAIRYFWPFLIVLSIEEWI